VINIPAKSRKTVADFLAWSAAITTGTTISSASIRQNAIDRVDAFVEANPEMQAGQ
jgi:hypothetical protein